MKKMVSLFLALALCLGLGASALADGGVELPDVTQFLSGWLADYGVTVELVKMDNFGAIIGVENVQDMRTVLSKTRDGVDMLFQLDDFALISSPDAQTWEQRQSGEYLYAYTGSASVGTVEDSKGNEGNLYFYIWDGNDQVDGISVEILMGDGISMKYSDKDTAAVSAPTPAPAPEADNIVPDAWAFFNQQMTHSDTAMENGKEAFFMFDPGSEPVLGTFEYANLLDSGRFGFTLTDVWAEPLGGADLMTFFVFDHPSVGEDEKVTQERVGGDITGAVILCIQDNQSLGWGGIYVQFSDALTVTDTGDRCTYTDYKDRQGAEYGVDGPMGCGVESSGTDTAAAPEPTPVPEADNIVPDAWAFFNQELNHYDTFVPNGRTAHFSLTSEGREACYEYMDLLLSGRFGFTLTETKEESFGGWAKTVYYAFDYPGTGPDQEITMEIDDEDVSADLTVKLSDWGNLDWCGLSLSFSDAMTVMDTGDRCTITGLREDTAQPSTGPMGSAAGADTSSRTDYDDDDDDDDDDDGRRGSYERERKCYKCNGDGEVECSQCDGARGKWIYDSVPDYDGDGYNTTVRTWESCSKCHGTGEMTCPVCDGEGTY